MNISLLIIFLPLFFEGGAVIKEGATFQLNKEQLANLPDNPKS